MNWARIGGPARKLAEIWCKTAHMWLGFAQKQVRSITLHFVRLCYTPSRIARPALHSTVCPLFIKSVVDEIPLFLAGRLAAGAEVPSVRNRSA